MREFKNLFGALGCLENSKVSCAAYYIRGEADLWWQQNEATIKVLPNLGWTVFQEKAVRIDNKQRLSLLEEDGELWIRANQGHTIKSVESESLLKPILSAEEIPACVHGTYKRLLHSILASGLKRMSRLHIHFACSLPSDAEVKSGFRRDVNMIIFLDTKKAKEDGIKFYKSDNGVILTEGLDGLVPAKYFLKIESWPKRNPVPFQV